MPATTSDRRALITRVRVDLRSLSDRPLYAIRLLLVADVHRRAVEQLLGGRVLLTVLSDARDDGQALAAQRKALAIADPTAGPPALGSAEPHPEAPVETAFQAPARPKAPPPSHGHVVPVAAATRPQGTDRSSHGNPLLLVGDPLTLRLALLRFPPAVPAALTRARLHRANETLQRWRFRVAGWRDTPEAEVPPKAADCLRAALLGLDTATALRVLHRQELDPRLNSGTKYATFTYADAVLALDVRRLEGRVRR